MEEVKNVEIDWVKKLPGDLWGGIAEYLPVEGDHLFNLTVTHPKITRKLNEDAQYQKRKKKYPDHLFADRAYGFFSKSIERDLLENIRKVVLLTNNHFSDAEDQEFEKVGKTKLRNVLIDPDSDAEIKVLKDEYEDYHFEVSPYGVALGMVAVGLLVSEVLDHIEDFGHNNATIDRLVKKASTVEWDEVRDSDGHKRENVAFGLLTLGVFFSIGGLAFLTVTALIGAVLNFFILEFFIPGIIVFGLGLAIVSAIIPLKACSAKKINKRMDFISEARDYFLEKEFQENNVNELEI